MRTNIAKPRSDLGGGTAGGPELAEVCRWCTTCLRAFSVANITLAVDIHSGRDFWSSTACSLWPRPGRSVPVA